MRFEQLEILIEVANNRSMQLAAEKLYTTIQNISKSIKALEKELNAPLFIRNKNGVFLTGDGQIVYQHALEIKKHIDYIKSNYITSDMSLPSDISGELHVLTSASMGTTTLNLIKSLSVKYPALKTSFIISESMEISNQLLYSPESLTAYEMIITSVSQTDLGSFENLRSQYDIYFLKQDRLGIRANRHDHLAQEKSIPLKTVIKLPLAIYQASTCKQSQLLKIIAEHGINLTPAFISNSTHNCAAYVQDGSAYILCTITQGEDEEASYNKGSIVIPLQEKLYLFHLLLINKKYATMPQCKIFKQMLLNKFSNTYRKLF
jgi:Transcriptional regulator